MVRRIQRGKRSDGSYGIDISIPGVDVVTATKIQKLFSSDLTNPLVVVKGSVVIPPIGGIPGSSASQVVIPYGRTIRPMPVVVAIATSPFWQIPLSTGTLHLNDFWNKWHTYLIETFFSNGIVNDYGTPITRVPAQPNTVPASWAACKFIITLGLDSFSIITNNTQSITVKYLVLDYN